ncbi:MAG: PorV/PorQ family protein [Prevotellaceae bacterium]|jgi:hypothetical protein|nr:PorV/PorQ family protein [Prevotellaceae bacterium]
MRIFVGIFAFALHFTSAYAQAAADFLSITPDARAAGVGSAGAALSPDASAQHHNVARYAFAPNVGGAALSYIPWTLENAGSMAAYYAAGFYRFERTAVSASVRFNNMGDIILTPDGQNFSTQSLNDFAIDMGYSRQITRHISAGVALRYVSVVRAELGGMTSSGAVAADVGAYFRLPVERNAFSAGLSLANVGTALDYGNNLSMSLPMSLNIGAGYFFNTLNNSSLSVSLNAAQPLVAQQGGEGVSLKQSLLSAGVEYGFMQMFFARAGYAYNSKSYGDQSHLAFGAGVLWRSISLDAAYLYSTSKRDNALVNVVRVTLGFVFAPLKDPKKQRLQPINPCNSCPD